MDEDYQIGQKVRFYHNAIGKESVGKIVGYEDFEGMTYFVIDINKDMNFLAAPSKEEDSNRFIIGLA